MGLTTCSKWVKVGISVVIYCLSVSAVPIYNKLVFTGAQNQFAQQHGLRKYPYPIATAFLQLGLVSVCLALASILGHVCCPAAQRRNSWLLGPHFWYKLQYVAPVGLLFGLKYGVTNWGLQLVPVGIHLLLQSSDLLWTVVTARLMNNERPGMLEYLAAFLSTVGSLLIATHAVQMLYAPLIPLLVNLLTPLMLALCVSTLRIGAKELFRPDNVLAGSMSPTEFTALKLALSSCTALVLAMLLESGDVELREGAGAGSALGHRTPWWEALAEQPVEGILAVLFGGVFVLIFQVNLTWLAGLTSALTVGIVGGLKVVPQWLLNALFQLQVNLSPLNVLGALCVLAASCLYAFACTMHETLVYGENGFEWKLRRQSSTSWAEEDASGEAAGDKARLEDPLLDVPRWKSTPPTPSQGCTRCITRPDFVLDAPAHLLIEAELEPAVGERAASRRPRSASF